jgi:DNA-binding transcriptional ArsR family regulator
MHLKVADVSKIRFAVSPTWEAVTSLRALGIASTTGLHSRWLTAVRPRLAPVDMRLLTTLVPARGYIPDFLHPAPARRTESLQAGLRQIAEADPDVVAGELTHLDEHPLAQHEPGRRARVELLTKLADHPALARTRIAAELERYWRVAVAPYWSRIRALLDADIAFRLEQLGDGGVAQVLGSLHPSVTFEGQTLSVVKYYEGHVCLRERGLILLPCAFSWPDVLVRTADPQPALTYPPRGLGRLWETPQMPVGTPLRGVLGQTRTRLLTQLDLPMTTSQLATHLDLTAPAVNAHLKALHSAGILAARRNGRRVYYSRTALAEHLLVGSCSSAHGELTPADA